MTANLQRALSDGDLPPLYAESPIVRTAPPGQLVFPLSLYLDGVAHTRLDSTLGISCYVTTGGKRHLLAVVRRSELCSCGCKGWCTLFPVWTFLAWQLTALANGEHPRVRHDGTEFRESEPDRAAAAGTPLGFRCMCLLVKSDVMEYCHSMGLPGFNDAISPCPLCFATLADFWYNCESLSPLGNGFERKGAHNYDTS